MFSSRSRSTALLRHAARLTYHRRWWSLLSVALHRDLATKLLDHPRLGAMPGSGSTPALGEALQIVMDSPEFSRLPMRVRGALELGVVQCSCSDPDETLATMS